MATTPDPLDDIDQRHCQLLDGLEALDGEIEEVLRAFTTAPEDRK